GGGRSDGATTDTGARRDATADRKGETDVPDGQTLTPGSACASDSQCASDHCVDGVCCESACSGQCQSCGESSNPGKCLTISGTPRGSLRARCTGTAPCQSQCDGTNPTACTFPGSTAQCAAAGCANGVVTSSTVCNGAGACTTASTTPCTSNQCADSTKCSGGCSASQPCGGGKYCDTTGVCLAVKGNGTPCQSAAECSSAQCVDGVCCNVACAGQCQGCAEANSVGTCATVTGAPRNGRAACAGIAPCVGTCGGTSATSCTPAGSSVICAAATCAGGSATPASVCNGAGACTTPTATACTSNQCADTTKCSGGCSASLPCASGQYCTSSAICAPLKGSGSACQSGTECTSTNCVDGVCCNTACAGQCQGCAESGSVGVCVSVSGAPRNGRAPCGGTAPCAGTCNGSSGAACTFAGSSVTCVAASCAGGVATSATVCNSAGACTTAATMSCASNQCADTTKCSGGCSASLPCTSGQYCTPSAACAPLKGNGTACQSGSECTSTNCVDGVCCNVACAGQCQACAESGSVGTCVTVKGAPRGTVRAPCSGTNASCVGSCGDTSATQCTYPTSATTCGSPSCSAGAAVKTPTCDGAGNCSTPSSIPCTPFICGATACLTTCTSNSQCVTGAACVSGVCTACGAGQTVCTNACANLTSTDANCGSCGHSCQGGGCVSGACQPKALMGQAISTYGLQSGSQLVNGNIYVLSLGNPGGFNYELWQIPTSGATATRDCVFDQSPGDLAIDGTSVYWIQADGSGGGFDLVSSPLSACKPNAPVQALPGPRSFGTDWVTEGPYFDPATTELVWLEEDSSDTGQRRLMRSTTSGSNVRTMTMFNVPTGGVSFTLPTLGGPTQLFWGVPEASGKHGLFYITTNLAGATPVAITSAAPGSGPFDIYANGQNVVWSGSTGSFIAPLPGGISGGGAPPLFVPSGTSVGLGLIDATSFYGYASPNAGSISKCAVSGCVPTVLVVGQSSANAFLQDTATLYWVNVVLGLSPTDPSALSVIKLAK
ncbi:MAG TPA: hypothetical protein VFG23_20585, partial [Polyangia bacterium]|nr:hypothetical protein [Polyangia bacterium]